jgi:hypothetical protein
MLVYTAFTWGAPKTMRAITETFIPGKSKSQIYYVK